MSPPPTWPAPHEQHRPATWSPPGGAIPPVLPGQHDQRGDQTAAVFGYLGMLLASLVVPLVFYLGRRGASPYVRHHSAQAINLTLTGVAYTVAGLGCVVPAPFLDATAPSYHVLAVTLPVVGYAVLGANAVTALIYLVVAAVRASAGALYRIPGWRCWRIVR